MGQWNVFVATPTFKADYRILGCARFKYEDDTATLAWMGVLPSGRRRRAPDCCHRFESPSGIFYSIKRKIELGCCVFYPKNFFEWFMMQILLLYGAPTKTKTKFKSRKSTFGIKILFSYFWTHTIINLCFKKRTPHQSSSTRHRSP